MRDTHIGVCSCARVFWGEGGREDYKGQGVSEMAVQHRPTPHCTGLGGGRVQQQQQHSCWLCKQAGVPVPWSMHTRLLLLLQQHGGSVCVYTSMAGGVTHLSKATPCQCRWVSTCEPTLKDCINHGCSSRMPLHPAGLRRGSCAPPTSPHPVFLPIPVLLGQSGVCKPRKSILGS